MQAYAREVNEHKRTLLLVNKADLLPFSVRLVLIHFFDISLSLHPFYVIDFYKFYDLVLVAERNGQDISIFRGFSIYFGQLRLHLQLWRGKN